MISHLQNMSQLPVIKDFMNQDSVQKKFEELLWKRAPQFITTVLWVVNSNNLLSNADPKSIYLASLVSATLDLPINPNLGFAYIVPYNNRKENKQEAQFQMWYKGFIQLAQRSGQFKTIDTVTVYESDTDEDVTNRLTSIRKTYPKDDKIVWYASYFKLLNWFEKTLYMSVEELEEHGKKYSQSYKRWFGVWRDNFQAMAEKTVLKLLLSKYAPLSVEMQTAVVTDQAVIQDEDLTAVEYVDNTDEVIEAEVEIDPELLASRESDLQECKTLEEVQKLQDDNKVSDKTILALFDKRTHELNK